VGEKGALEWAGSKHKKRLQNERVYLLFFLENFHSNIMIMKTLQALFQETLEECL
jgi:hypothetical protein